MITYARAAALLSGFIVMAAAMPAKADLIITAEADAYVRGGGYANINYGSETFLNAKRDGGLDNTRKIWFRFDLSSVTWTVTEATLTLTIGANNLGTEPDPPNTWNFSVYGVNNGFGENWNESTITWNNAPANNTSSNYNVQTENVFGGAPLATFSITGKGTLGATCTVSGGAGSALVNFLNSDTDGRATFIVVRTTQGTTTDTIVHQFASRENGTYAGPTLTLVPEPATVGLVGFAMVVMMVRSLRKGN